MSSNPQERDNTIKISNLDFFQDIIENSPPLLDLYKYPFAIRELLIQLPPPKLKLVLKNAEMPKSKEEIAKYKDLVLGELDQESTNKYRSQKQDLGSLGIYNLTFFYRNLAYHIYSKIQNGQTIEEVLDNTNFLVARPTIVSLVNERIGFEVGDKLLIEIFETIGKEASKQEITFAHSHGISGVALIEENLTEQNLQRVKKKIDDEIVLPLLGKFAHIPEEIKQYVEDYKHPLVHTCVVNLGSAINNLSIPRQRTRNRTFFELSSVIGESALFLGKSILIKDEGLHGSMDDLKKQPVLLHEILNLDGQKVQRKTLIDCLNLLREEYIFYSDLLQQPERFVELSHVLKARLYNVNIEVAGILERIQHLRG